MTQETIRGWVGAALQLEEVEESHSARFEALMRAMGRHLYVATSPDTPEDERAALLASTIKFAAAVHERVRTDRLNEQMFHLALIAAAEQEGAGKEMAAFQSRIVAANTRYLTDKDLAAKRRSTFLDTAAPQEDPTQSEGDDT